MPLLNSVVNWLNFKRIYQIQLYREHPLEIQNETLFDLINNAKDTVWGKKFSFKEIQSIDDFQSVVPLQTYSDIKPYVELLMAGEKDILWPGEVKWNN